MTYLEKIRLELKKRWQWLVVTIQDITRDCVSHGILKEEIIMNSFENNAFFWQKLDTLFLSSKLVIDRPRNTCQYKYSNLVYPVDYGYLNDTTGLIRHRLMCSEAVRKAILYNPL